MLQCLHQSLGAVEAGAATPALFDIVIKKGRWLMTNAATKITKIIADFKTSIEKQYSGCVLENDGFCLMLEAPPRTTWDGDLHEFVHEYRCNSRVPLIPKNVKSAITDMAERVEWYGEPTPCEGPCEWCDGD